MEEYFDSFEASGFYDETPDCDCGVIHSEEEEATNKCAACGKPVEIVEEVRREDHIGG